MSRVIVVGGGPAGMLAAIMSARAGNEVTLYEHNEKLGKKLFITGKGRCNVTNACDNETLLENVVTNEKFMFSAFSYFNAQNTMDFFEDLGVRLKVERGNRVFPQSDHSSDIIRALEYELRRVGVKIELSKHVKELLTEDYKVLKEDFDKEEGDCIPIKQHDPNDKYKKKAKKKEMNKICKGILLENGQKIMADAVILATGGISYPLTGADQSGMNMVKEQGMKVTKLYPALVPLLTKEAWGHALMGLALKNISVTIKQGKKCLYDGFGEMLFTHVGVSGPLILSASSKLTQKVKEQEADLWIDLKPALTNEQLDKRLLRDFESQHNKSLKNAMAGLLPSRLIVPVIHEAKLVEEQKVNTLTKQQRQALCFALKNLHMTITGTANFNEAIITQGGISVKDVNASTMESKRIKNLYLAGECLDVDAYTGGFNLQIAWATGYVAGLHAATDH